MRSEEVLLSTYLAEVSHEQATPGRDAHHAQVGSVGVLGHHVLHHQPRVLGVPHDVEFWRSEAHRVASPVEHTAPPASPRGRPEVVRGVPGGARDGVQEDDERSVVREVTVCRPVH